MSEKPKPTVIVTQKPDQEPIPAQVAKGMKALSTTRLRRRAVITLIHEESKIARRDIEIVLDNLDTLEVTWLKSA